MSQTAVIVDGKEIAEHWLRDIAVQIRVLGTTLHLASVAIEGDEGLAAFVRLKQKAAHRTGIQCSAYTAAGEEQAQNIVRWLAADDTVHGIFVELPVPSAWDEQKLLGLVPVAKDVDVISPLSEQAFYEDASLIVPPAVAALDRVLKLNDVARNGDAVVIGNGKLVGRPCAHWLQRQGFRVRVIDIETEHPVDIARTADLLVCGAGVPGLVTGEWVKEGATVIDFGYARKDNTYVGDTDEVSVRKRARLLTPVPGGMGPLVIAATLENLLALGMVGA